MCEYLLSTVDCNRNEQVVNVPANGLMDGVQEISDQRRSKLIFFFHQLFRPAQAVNEFFQVPLLKLSAW